MTLGAGGCHAEATSSHYWITARLSVTRGWAHSTETRPVARPPLQGHGCTNRPRPACRSPKLRVGFSFSSLYKVFLIPDSGRTAGSGGPAASGDASPIILFSEMCAPPAPTSSPQTHSQKAQLNLLRFLRVKLSRMPKSTKSLRGFPFPLYFCEKESFRVLGKKRLQTTKLGEFFCFSKENAP